MVVYKTIDLFGNEQIQITEKKKKQPSLFNDYNAFLDKFEQKKTTDDCYTPTEIYNAVLNYVGANFNISEMQIMRPFYPNGDYETIEYPNNCIVIDNPPFSIVSKIARFYIKNNVKFFIFAPHMTLFSSDLECTAVVVGGDIVYENGAVVKTSFLTNIFEDIRILGAPELHNELKAVSVKNKVSLPKYDYPNNIITVSRVQKFVENGIKYKVKYSDCKHCCQLDSQKKHKKTLFGSGFLLSEKAAAEKAAAEKAAVKKDIRIIWELSKRELDIIKSLNK